MLRKLSISQKSIFIISALITCLGLGSAVTPAYALDEASDPVVTSEIDEPTGPSIDNGEVVTPPDDEDDIVPDNTTTDDEATDETSEPEMWPVYVSLGALGGALILVIIINLALGRKRK